MKAEDRDSTIRYLILEVNQAKREIDDVRAVVTGPQYDYLDSRMFEASKHLEDALTALGFCVGYRSIYRTDE